MDKENRKRIYLKAATEFFPRATSESMRFEPMFGGHACVMKAIFFLPNLSSVSQFATYDKYNPKTNLDLIASRNG